MTEIKNGLTLVEQDKLGYLELHLAEAVKNSLTLKLSKSLLKSCVKRLIMISFTVTMIILLLKHLLQAIIKQVFNLN